MKQIIAQYKLESGGQQLSAVKKKLSGNSFDHEKSSFFIKSTKNTFLHKSQNPELKSRI